jgi:type IV pilus assembly protein PilQ
MSKKTVLLLFMLLILSIPLLCFAQFAKKPEAKISFDFMDADVRNVLRILAEVSGKNIIISDDVKGKVTMKLDNISWNEALDIVIKTNSLAKIDEENVIRIITDAKYYAEKDKGRKDRLEFLKEKTEKLKSGEELVLETVYLNYAKAGDVEKMIKGEATGVAVGGSAATGQQVTKGFLSEFGTITQVSWNNALIIKDNKDNVERMVKIIKEHDVAPTQVQIEARIVVAESTFSRNLGIKWTAALQDRIKGINRDTSVSGTVTEAVTGAGTLRFILGTAADAFWLDGELSAQEKEGLLKTISHPKVVTSDNQKAKIAQGEEVPYTYVAQAGATPTTEFKKVELSLEVTPHVTRDGNVKLDIKATKNEVKTFGTLYGATTKEATTEVIVQDGDTAVLGGVYETHTDDSEEGLPFLRSIPIIGYLFKQKLKTDNKTELLIFVTPTVQKKLYKIEG